MLHLATLASAHPDIRPLRPPQERSTYQATLAALRAHYAEYWETLEDARERIVRTRRFLAASAEPIRSRPREEPERR